MKKTFLSLLALGFCLLLSSQSQAQEFTVYGEGIIPTGRYGMSTIATSELGYRPVSAITDTNNALGGASYGWGAGIQMAFPLANRDFDILVDAGFRMNWVDDKLQAYYNDYASANHTEGITSAPHYYNIPLMIGPRFSIDPINNLGFYASVLAGFNIRIISDAIYSPSLFYDYYSAGTFALRAAAGILLFDHLRIEANWSWLGNDPVEASIYDGTYHERGVLGDLETMHLGLRLGWTF